ncbi:hypothetical protein DTO280E4_4504 [Paecilomyces variotii]|nr:hypothetical protein DTO207G8_7151 [Paecilomyces variotii]KAJ9286702.1 hypothetical protein DTO021C3_5651 [Paecilomyces variotii]KAJ9304571.1 hypothetical protein DTO217A2_5939 [Paecilomyces variotii]KAJ9359826.1 hypothetical protein DTO280E4_4504 [Paecilomyces variotii]KAJ9367980.1 hypothetical protein DTO282E5_7290 [Paecilomyces variotii]
MRTDFGQVGYTAILEGGLSIWGEPENVNALVECKALRRRDAMAHFYPDPKTDSDNKDDQNNEDDEEEALDSENLLSDSETHNDESDDELEKLNSIDDGLLEATGGYAEFAPRTMNMQTYTTAI